MAELEKESGWVRMDILKNTVGDPVPKPGEKPILTVNNGVQGDPRPSNAKLGKKIFDMKVDYAVAEIKRLLAGIKASQ